MIQTSALYKELLAGNHWNETRVSIGDTGRLINRSGDYITFGGVRILVASSGADSGYNESMLADGGVNAKAPLFSGDEPTAGGCVSREIDIKMLKPAGNIEGLERLAIYTRLTDGDRFSEWLPQGVYFIDEIQSDAAAEEGDPVWLDIHGFDALMFAEQDYPANSKLSWPARDIDVVREIASAIGVTVDSRTVALMMDNNLIQYPGQYSCRETLSGIAAMYAGCFVMSERGELRLVCFWDIPKETRYLVTNQGYAITFGGVRILV